MWNIKWSETEAKANTVAIEIRNKVDIGCVYRQKQKRTQSQLKLVKEWILVVYIERNQVYYY